MKIYYSNMASISQEHADIEIPKIGVLISFFGLRELKVPKFCDSMFLDSGAFSAWNQKKAIDVQALIKFVKANKKQIDVYAALDDIESYEKSIVNFKKMLDAGLSPIPTYHFGEPEWVLDEYVSAVDYIALGGIAKRSRPVRLNWLDGIFSKYPTTRFHGFGIQEKIVMERFPWASIDGTFAHYAARLGGIRSPYGAYVISTGAADKYKLDAEFMHAPNAKKKVIDWIESLGINYAFACEPTARGTTLRALINIIYLETFTKKKINYVPTNTLGV